MERAAALGESIKYLGERFLGTKSKLSSLKRCENSYDKKEKNTCSNNAIIMNCEVACGRNKKVKLTNSFD